jgi:hypothetical protein
MARRRLKIVCIALSAVLLTLCLSTGAFAKHHIEFRDFSAKGPDYKPLEDLRLAVDDITYTGTEPIEVLGKSYTASAYTLDLPLRVQTECAMGPVDSQTYDSFPARFQVLVIDDKDRKIHDAYIRQMYDFSSKNESRSGTDYFDFNVKRDQYILSSIPEAVEVKQFFFFWVNERLVKVIFEGFRDPDKGGFGIMNSFSSNHFRVRIKEAEFQALQNEATSAKKFLALYKSGFFNRPPIAR